VHKFWGLGTLIFTGASLLAAPAAWAATETQNMTVTATVTNSCAISSSNNLNFGAVEPSSTTPHDDAVNIVITCVAEPQAGALLTVGDGLNAGLKTSFPNSRAMLRSGGANNDQNDLLAYDLYSDAARNDVISLLVGTSEDIDLTEGTDMSTTIYGRIPPSQTVASDNTTYSDTVLLTLTYTP
jgi:spore coat protein U-like protein